MNGVTITQLAAVLWWAEGNALEALEEKLGEHGDSVIRIERQFGDAPMTAGTRARWLNLARKLRGS